MGIGIETLGDLANSDPKILKSLIGINGIYFWQYANDNRPVLDYNCKKVIQTIGNSSTLYRRFV
ncbi:MULTISPECIES: hypothetical protein [Anaerococcus]|uniref:hypothetical protein n=1 Tax=Anaerococcus TaxID=165779 RepID=UPI001E31360E|nr:MULTISPECIES: hypothetical protein [Anaerococcus]MDY3006812.1 hypothetical protein [Anaerococcus porci]